MKKQPLISKKSLANFLGVTVPHITNLVKRGKLSAIRVGTKWMFEETEIERFINDNRIKGAY